MKKNRIAALALSLAMTLALAACGGKPGTPSSASGGAGSDGQTQQAVTLKLSSTIAVGAPGDLAANDFKAMVEERTNGLVTIDYYPASQLGSADETSEQLLAGTIDMNWQTLDWYMNLQKDWNVLGLGFAVGSKEQVQRFLDSDKEAEIEQKLIEEDGIRLIANNGIATPRVLVSTMPVNAAGDLDKVNMRVPAITLYTKTWEAVGVNCITLGTGDVYMGFKDGMINATEFPLGSVYSNAYHEVAKYITYTNHLYSIYVMGVNEANWQSKLTPETQQIIQECAQEACQKYMEYDAEAVQTGVDAMKEAGVTINETPDLDSFVERLAPVAAECEAEGLWSEGLFDYLTSLA